VRIELQDVRKAYHEGRVNEFWAINGISLTFDPERITCLRGASGSGKTTLLSIIGCLARPTSGRVLLDGRVLSGLPERFLTEVRRHTFGFVFQRFNLIDGLSVLDNVMVPAFPLGPVHSELKSRAHRLLERFRIAHKADSPVNALSGGEAQRVTICRALINDPAILIADEPTANLDSALSDEFMTLLEGLRDDGTTVLVASHDAIVYDSPVVDRVVCLHDGRAVGGTD